MATVRSYGGFCDLVHQHKRGKSMSDHEHLFDTLDLGPNGAVQICKCGKREDVPIIEELCEHGGESKNGICLECGDEV